MSRIAAEHAVDPDLAVCRQEQRIQVIGQRRLAGPVRADQGHELVPLDRQIDAAQRQDATTTFEWVCVFEVLGADNGHRHYGSVSFRCDPTSAAGATKSNCP